jgi:phosphomevalonate kinase
VRARAPGKIVLSGAYAVLEGAPSIVAAVDRAVVADASLAASFVTDEVRAAIDAGVIERAPWFDASALRTSLPDGTSRKLGLGSSAAILVASIAAAAGERLQRAGAGSLADAVFPAAYAAHRKAQPGGSGIDVAASTFGGVITATIRAGGLGLGLDLDVAPHQLPRGTVVEVFASPVSASTGDLIRRVRAFAAVDPPRYRQLLDAAARGSHAAKAATTTPDFIAAIGAQLDALAELGALSGAGIVTPEAAAVRPVAAAEGAIFGPSGAGGGDIAVYIGGAPSSARLRALAQTHGYTLLDLTIAAPGVTWSPSDL